MIEYVNTKIWGREFSLRVKFRCHSGERVIGSQIKAFEKIMGNPMWIEKSRKCVEGFCRQQVYEDDTNHKKDNIFSYIQPDYIFIGREDIPNVAIMCNYRYDSEHGLAIVFDHNGNVTVGTQDIIL